MPVATWLQFSWVKLKNKEQEIEKLQPNRLDEILQQFYAEVKKKPSWKKYL